MDKCREQFEEWYSEFYIPQDSNDIQQQIIKSMALKAWQASRRALVVELPDPWDSNAEIGSYSSAVRSALDNAGIKWTE